jgi:hypothetical protein
MPFNFPNNPTVNQYSRQNGRVYQWNGYSWDLFADNFLNVSVLVVAGGGGGSNGTSTSGSSPGGAGGFIEDIISITTGKDYAVSIGAGAPAQQNGPIGNSSMFGSIIAIGGGQWIVGASCGMRGASGAGSPLGSNATILTISSAQGNNGGTGSSNVRSGGGGGAGGNGANAVASGGGNGGAAKLSSIPVVPTYFSGGGGGGTTSGTTRGLGGKDPIIGGGGDGGDGTNIATNGAANSGGGGGGGGQSATASIAAGGSGGSGVIILRFDASLNISFSGGLSYSIAFTGNDEVVTITSGTGTVTFTV